MRSGGASSLTPAENWAESATTAKPQTSERAARSRGSAPKRNPISAHHDPLTAMAAEVTAVRPQRSASLPATRLPAAPAAMKPNPAKLAHLSDTPEARKLATRNTGPPVQAAQGSPSG